MERLGLLPACPESASCGEGNTSDATWPGVPGCAKSPPLTAAGKTWGDLLLLSVGRYVPDLWLTDGSRLADHSHGGGFVLLDRTPDGAFARLASAWAGRVSGVTDEPATPIGVLVRPDGVVAWATVMAAPPLPRSPARPLPTAADRPPCS